MKQIKLFSVMLLLATMFLSFNACSDDDNDNPDNGNKSKKIAKIVNESDIDDIRTGIFIYSKGKMSKHTAQYRGESEFENNQTITYSGNTVIMDGLLDGCDCVQTYTLNDKGLAISCKMSPKDDCEEKDFIFQYSDGYLIGISCTNSSGDKEIYTFTYSGGNIVNATELYSNDKTTYTFTYSDNENKGGIISPLLSELLFEHTAAYYMGILGKATKNLAISCDESDKWSTDNYTCVYSLDNDGYVTTAISSLDGKFTYTFG